MYSILLQRRRLYVLALSYRELYHMRYSRPLLADFGFVEHAKFLDFFLETGNRRQVLLTSAPRTTAHTVHLAKQVAESVVEVNKVLLLLGRGVEH